MKLQAKGRDIWSITFSSNCLFKLNYLSTSHWNQESFSLPIVFLSQFWTPADRICKMHRLPFWVEFYQGYRYCNIHSLAIKAQFGTRLNWASKLLFSGIYFFLIGAVGCEIFFKSSKSRLGWAIITHHLGYRLYAYEAPQCADEDRHPPVSCYIRCPQATQEYSRIQQLHFYILPCLQTFLP